tara:strand:+ start:330 stop:545 length:216 start_codon:yes stop_codon:yes gene_type:complete
MRKLLKKWVCKIFHIKQCACPEEIDPHEELYLEPKKPEIPVYENEKAVKAEHCGSHLRFRKTCPDCLEAVK